MFKDNFIKYCNQIGEAPTVVCKKMGLSSAAFSKWTNESIPRKATLQKFADYFGITVEELLLEETEPSVHVNNGIIGNQNTHNVVSVSTARADLGEIETEIVNICKKLDIKRKNALLTRAYELLEENK